MHWNGRFCPWRHQPVISYSTSFVAWWAYQTAAYAECPCLRRTHSILSHALPWVPFKGSSCRVPPHHQLETRRSPVLALHSHPLSSCTSERQHVCSTWGLPFLGIATQDMTLHCLYANAAYMGFVHSFFFSLWLCISWRRKSISVSIMWGQCVYSDTWQRKGLLCFLSSSLSPLHCPNKLTLPFCSTTQSERHDLQDCPWPKEIAVTGNQRLKSGSNHTVCKSRLVNNVKARNIINV